jgi:hypothetical protein
MRKLFDSIDFAKVGHYQSILDGHGIETHLKNQALSSIMGEVPFAEVFPELWVVNDGDYDEAMRLLREHRELAPSRAEDWVCPKCGEQVPKEFGSCWNCETDKPVIAPAT